jgi:transposase
MTRKEAPRSVRKAVRLKDRIATLKQEMRRLEGLQKQMKASADGQVSLTDPDARSMASQGKGTGIVGYNVQAAVDAEHHLIVTHEVTNIGSDRDQLYPMAEKAREAMGTEELTAVADRGYYKSEEILACHQAGIVPMVPKSMISTAEAHGHFGKEAFRYVPRLDEYRCPANQRLTKHMTTIERGLILHRYWSSKCGACALKSRCTPGTERPRDALGARGRVRQHAKTPG